MHVETYIKKMSSRRLMNRSLSSDGRSYYSANDITSPNRRSGGRSYLSSVRSESRSTLCSVMAQLAEEMQPTFESTLKSKAVSEDTNVKFNCVVSGYPVPEVTWYKDDIQLDRYCGLPKYEISHEDKTHTLQIYNCTLEDAAIYQASAQNSRGIVSCSGVLEVGTMSEYKIHQNYFAKLKLRNENRRRELEEHRNIGKNNVPAVLEHDRMISPERAQRKRRSMETRRAGSPSEEKAVEVDVLSQIPPLEERLAPHVQVSEAASFHGISNSEMIANRDSEGLTYVHDTVQRAFSKETNEHNVKKKLKITTAATEISKENRPTGRREEMNERVTANEKMEVQNTVVTESRNKMDITDRQKGEKQPVIVNKSDSKESKRAQCAQIASVTESRTKMVITDTKMEEKQSVNVNKSACEESTRAKGVQITSVTESRNKMGIIDTKMNEKQLIKVNKSAFEESTRAKGAQITTKTESRNKMLKPGTKTDEKQSVKVNKSLVEESHTAQGAQIASVTESRTKMVITDTKMDEKQSVKANKSASEESTRAKGAQITKMIESRNKIFTKDTKMDEKQSVKANKNLAEESKTTQGAQIASVTESRAKMDITDRQKREQQPVIVNKSASEEPKRAKGAQIASATESRNKMVKINEKQSVNVNKSPSNESKSAQDTQITTVTESRKKMDITDTRKSEKQSENAKKSPSNESNRVQKPTAIQNLLDMKVALTTQTNEIVENKKLTKSSDKGASNLQLQALDTIQNWNPRFTDNKLMDFDDHKNGNPVGTCVRILSHSCGGNDVSVDTGERNASACSLRGLAADDTHTEPTEPPIHEDIPPFHKEVVKKLKEQPPLMCEVTASATDTLSSSYLSSQGQKLRAGDQSVASTKSTQPSEKMSSGHVSHMLCDGQVTTAMSSSLGDDTITDVCEKDSKAENQLIKESDKPQDETKPASKSLMTNLNTSTNVHVQNNISKEKSTADSTHSTNQVIVTEFVQICTLNSDVMQSQIMNSSSISKVENKDTDAKEFRSSSLVPTENIPKMDTQEQSKVTTFEVPVSTHHKTQSYSAKKGNDHSGPSTFLSQHSKASPREFTIPTICITDVDSTSQNSTDKTEHTVCENAINESDPVKIRTEANPVTSHVTNSNTVSQKSTPTHSDCTDFTNKTTVVLESESLRSQTSEVNKPDQQPLSQENLIQGPKSSSYCSTENVDTQRHNADKSTKANESDLTETSHLLKTDLNLKTDSDFFIKQLKSAALDLEMSNQSSTTAMFNAATHINSRDNDKYGEEGSSAAILPGVCKVTIPLKNTDHQANSTTHSEMATRMNQKTTFPSTKTEKSEIGMTVSLEEANRDVYQGGKLSLKTQPESPLQSVSNSPLKTSFETHSPRLIRRSIPADLPKPAGNENNKPKSTEKDKENQFKVPQVIRKIRPEIFDASGHLKLWCQFFNIVSDSTIRWYKDEVEIAEIKRSAGDETQLCLAIIRMSKRDCGVYRCTITNDYGKDSTEYLLSTEFLSNMFLCEELQEVGEEIEMTPLIFSKGLADAGCWGSKFYGRVTTEEPQVGMGCEHKTRRLKVIYGLDPVFESGSSCFLKVRSPIVYESREETVLAERNLQITKQECRIQNMAREYFKIFAAETRVIESFGAALEVIPLYFMYCPASSIPYATVEAELKGVYMRYCSLDCTGSLVLNEKIEVGQKCSSLQHWIHQWTNGNVLFSRLDGVDTILTNVGIAIRSKGYQGFPCEAHPKVFEQFHIQHQCNYFCGLLNLKPLKAPEILQTPTRSKGSSSPLIQRRTASSSSSPQTSRKATKSPTVSRKINPQTST